MFSVVLKDLGKVYNTYQLRKSGEVLGIIYELSYTIHFRVVGEYAILTYNYQDYFTNWLSPTEAEMVAFCLEHDIIY